MSGEGLVERLEQAAAAFDAIQLSESGHEDSDCEPHWSIQCEAMDSAAACREAADALTAAETRIQELEAIIDNARMAYAETHPDDETRCRFMAAALSAVDD